MQGLSCWRHYRRPPSVEKTGLNLQIEDQLQRKGGWPHRRKGAAMMKSTGGPWVRSRMAPECQDRLVSGWKNGYGWRRMQTGNKKLKKVSLSSDKRSVPESSVQLKRDLKRITTLRQMKRGVKRLTADTDSLVQVWDHNFINHCYWDILHARKSINFKHTIHRVLTKAYISVTTTTIMKYHVPIIPSSSLCSFHSQPQGTTNLLSLKFCLFQGFT